MGSASGDDSRPSAMLSELRRTKLTVFIEMQKFEGSSEAALGILSMKQFDGSSEAALGVLWMDLVWYLGMN